MTDDGTTTITHARSPAEELFLLVQLKHARHVLKHSLFQFIRLDLKVHADALQVLIIPDVVLEKEDEQERNKSSWGSDCVGGDCQKKKGSDGTESHDSGGVFMTVA